MLQKYKFMREIKVKSASCTDPLLIGLGVVMYTFSSLFLTTLFVCIYVSNNKATR
jgi:hypothetical protein